ncbi:RNA polymerase sporulation specific sigma factor SigF [Lachnospiraceae bacterium TWA4]|nr:RNA polymerase sporulation specific sigma factor SigF [Lachnospiraceae bacterium TWA4]
MKDIRNLLQLAHNGDTKARDELVEENTGLIWNVVKRFLGRGQEAEDLFQIGSIGLLKAIDHFDFSYDVKFSTYAVPMISGEIKRFLRDDGMIKVSRSLKEIAYKVYQTKEKLERELGRELTMDELSKATGISTEDLVLALDASLEVESLQKTIYQDDGNDISLQDKIPEKINEHEQLLERIRLEGLLTVLNNDERDFIRMRYFEELTQTQIANLRGISQVQVSRLEKKILKKMRESRL